MTMRYSEALQEAIDEAGRYDVPIVFRVTPEKEISRNEWGDWYETSLSDVIVAAIEVAHQSDSTVRIEKQIGGEDAPWVAVRRVSVAVENLEV